MKSKKTSYYDWFASEGWGGQKDAEYHHYPGEGFCERCDGTGIFQMTKTLGTGSETKPINANVVYIMKVK